MSDINNALDTEPNKKLDAQAKKIIANKKFLARLLQKYVPEFKDIAYDAILNEYIEPKIYTGSVAVERDMTNPSIDVAEELSDTIDGIMNEDTTSSEGKVTYDVLFKVKSPKDTARIIEFFINVEAQAKYNPGYPLETRAVYYVSRRFASQLRHITEKTDYGKLEKAYSIWLVMGDTVPQKAAGTVSYYHMTKEDIVGYFPQDSDIYDKISVIMIRFDEKTEIADPYIRSLQTVFRKSTSREEKKAALESQGIALDSELEGEVDDMCNYGSYVASSSRNEGILEGKREGRKEGIIQGSIDTYREMGFSDREIAEKLKAKYHLDEKEIDEALCVTV